MNRALPGWAVDAIRDGVPTCELAARGDRAVWTLLRRTAVSAAARGWTRSEWEGEVCLPSGTLAQQIRRRGVSKMRTPAQFVRQFDSAWSSAVGWLEKQPAALEGDEVQARGERAAIAVLAAVEDPETELNGRERAVLHFAVAVLRRHHDEGKPFDRVALPRRDVAAGTGLSERVARAALVRLVERGLLVVSRPGQSDIRQGVRTTGRPYRLATLYRLADPEPLAQQLYRKTRSMGRPVQTYGTPALADLGTAEHTYGTPALAAHTSPEGPSMVTLTITAPDADALAAALAALRREQDVAVHEIPDNVRHLRPIVKDAAL